MRKLRIALSFRRGAAPGRGRLFRLGCSFR